MNLSLKFDNVMNYYPKNKRKYIHWKSLRNFIYHLDTFPNERQKNKIQNTLLEYLQLINERSVIEDSKDSLKYFKEYLQPIGQLYEDNLKFHIIAKTSTIVFWSSLALIVFYFLNVPYSLSIGLLSVDFLLFVRHYYYARQKRCYSVFY